MNTTHTRIRIKRTSQLLRRDQKTRNDDIMLRVIDLLKLLRILFHITFATVNIERTEITMAGTFNREGGCKANRGGRGCDSSRLHGRCINHFPQAMFIAMTLPIYATHARLVCSPIPIGSTVPFPHNSPVTAGPGTQRISTSIGTSAFYCKHFTYAHAYT